MVNAISPLFDRIKLHDNPIANPKSMVVCGQARFTVLTSRLIRLEWSTNNQFVDQSTFAFPSRYSESPVFSCKGDDSQVEIATETLTLKYVSDGKPFHLGNLSIRFNLDGKQVEWNPGLVNDGNLRGTRRTLDQFADAVSLPEGLLSRDRWSLFDDSNSVMWKPDQIWLGSRPDEHVHDWYFFGYGHDYKTLLREYIQFGGDIPLVPRYVLGTWWSRFWAYHADDLKQLVTDFQSHDIPLDVLVVDMDWHTPDGWTGYSWNRNLFPDPEAFLEWVHSQNLYATLNLHPAEGIQKHEDAYPEFARLMGVDTAKGEGVNFDATDPKFIQHYFELLHHPMEEQGVDFWWIDWQQGTDTTIKNLDPLPWLNHLHFKDATRRGKRPLLYSRWGGLGNHRYPIGFSGDAYTTWEALAFQPYFTATAANVGYGWWSHDIGGHFGAADPELYARWVQFGAMSPCLRLHSTKDPLAERRPWAFPEPAYHAAKAAMQLRYKLFPYIYSSARNLSQTGLSLCYPMYYEYPDSEDAYLARGQYFFGDQLVVAPLVSPTDTATGLASIDVWIPEGTWYEYTTQERFVGPRWVQISGDLNRIPIFAKAGAILPMSPRISSTKEFDGSRYELIVFPGSEGRFEIYEDDGFTEAYKQGEFETTLVKLSSSSGNTIKLTIGGAEGHCPNLPATRAFAVHFKGIAQPQEVTVNQVPVADWNYHADTSELVITIADVSRTTLTEIAITTEPAVKDETVQTDIAPFVHCVDYTTFEDARQQLGTIVIVPPTDGSVFDAEIEWTLSKAGAAEVKTQQTLRDCTTRQIVQSPYRDEGDFVTFRWGVTIDIKWRGKPIHYRYESQDAYPSVSNWQTVIYNPQTEPHTIKDVVAADGNLNPELNWVVNHQASNELVNIKQPFGLVLLKDERQRIMDGESLEACVAANLFSAADRKATLYVQSVGDAKCYLNGVELVAVEPIAHAKLNPMFDSWMPPQQKYYTLPLKEGANQIIIFSTPDTLIKWWGIGATIFDEAGKALV